MPLPATQVHQWTRGEYLISTDPSLIPLATLNEALASDRLSWARRLSDEEIQTMVQSSVCFALYHINAEDATKRPLIGFARLVTDKVTFAYLTDVYVLPEWAGRGLGTWVVDCVKEWLGLVSSLRQTTLITGGGKDLYYAKKLGTSRIEDLAPGVGIYVAPGPACSWTSTSKSPT